MIGRSLRVLAAAATLASLGCRTTPSPTVGTLPANHAIDDAIDEAIPVLARTDPDAAARWRAWRARHDRPTVADLRGDDAHPMMLTLVPGTFRSTAYAAPILDATLVENATHRWPILAAPPDEVAAEDLPTRRELAEQPARRPPALGWVADALDAYLAEVNGSVALRLPDGSFRCLGWARTNERAYTSLGRRLVEEGLADPDTIDLAVIRDRHDADPATVQRLMLDNDRVVFFEPVPADRWPRASTGARLIPRHAAAVDPAVIPLGSVLVIEGDGVGPLVAVAVDIGGAITGRRIDLYLGAGDEAIAEAGGFIRDVSVSILEPAP